MPKDRKSRAEKKKNKYIFYLKTRHTPAFKQTIELINKYVSESKITFTNPEEHDENDNDNDYYDEFCADTKQTKAEKKQSGGITMMKVTKDQTVYLKLRLYAENFDSYICPKDSYSIGVDMQSFHLALKMVNDDCGLEIYMTRDNTGTMFVNNIEQKHDRRHRQDTSSAMNLLEIPEDEKTIKKVEFQNQIKIETGVFANICKRFGGISNKITITCSGGMVEFSAKSESSVSKIRHEDMTYDNKRKGNDIIQGTYDLKNLTGFSKCNKLCDVLYIYFLDQFPLVLVIPITPLGKLYVFISPVVTE